MHLFAKAKNVGTFHLVSFQLRQVTPSSCFGWGFLLSAHAAGSLCFFLWSTDVNLLPLLVQTRRWEWVAQVVVMFTVGTDGEMGLEG